MSVPHTPHAATLISTSPSRTSGTGTSSTRTTPFPRNTPARIVFGIGPNVFTCSTTTPAPLISPSPLLPFQGSIAESVLELPQDTYLETQPGSPQPFHCVSRTSLGQESYEGTCLPGAEVV